MLPVDVAVELDVAVSLELELPLDDPALVDPLCVDDCPDEVVLLVGPPVAGEEHAPRHAAASATAHLRTVILSASCFRKDMKAFLVN